MRNAYDDTIVMDADFNPEDLPERPPSQMDYDEIIAFHLQKYWSFDIFIIWFPILDIGSPRKRQWPSAVNVFKCGKQKWQLRLTRNKNIGSMFTNYIENNPNI